ncbi:MAG TPA: sugar ABC transporter ATP-binding protein, partial [Acidimicrobiales bacterium]|nr:sugar ABC transporter ATP-binding protein [Acidimicrobiales bacterium]
MSVTEADVPANDAPATPVLELLGISKHFAGTDALVDVGVQIDRPMIYGIVGQNGAGKSTLLKILAGDYRPTSGEIRLGGKPVDISNQRHALSLGIGIVYQEFSLLPNLSVAHNILLGQEPTRKMRVDERQLFAEAGEALARAHASSIQLNRRVADLTLSQRQLVEIAKVLSLRRPRVLIFDEPTAALGHVDVDHLFEAMRRLRDEGVTILFVSHRYREVLTICERVSVMRNGRVVASMASTDTSLEHLVELTVGQKTAATFDREARHGTPGEVVLEAEGLRVGHRVRGVDLRLRRSEIVGLCGLLGSGQNELARAVAGDAADVGGRLAVRGEAVRLSSPRHALRLGIAIMSESRQDEGLFPDLRVDANISIASLWRLFWARMVPILSRRKEKRLTRGASALVGLSEESLGRLVSVLSGGNQQKAVLARWMMRHCDVLVMIEPTRGVDVGARMEIYRQI